MRAVTQRNGMHKVTPANGRAKDNLQGVAQEEAAHSSNKAAAEEGEVAQVAEVFPCKCLYALARRPDVKKTGIRDIFILTIVLFIYLFFRYTPFPTRRPPVVMAPPPQTGFHDPRGIREYVDLDAPSEDVPQIDYRTAT
jgi:hypothetical protein